MGRIAQTYEQIIENVIGWARGDDGIRAVAMIGSRARADHPADEWADLDLILVTADPQPYLESSDWLPQIAIPWISFVEASGDGRVLERRVLFEGGLDVDFAFEPLEMAHQMARSGLPPDVADMFRRGVRVLLDKDGLFVSIPELEGTPFASVKPPSQEESVVPQNKKLLYEKRSLKRKCYRTSFHNLATFRSIWLRNTTGFRCRYKLVSLALDTNGTWSEASTRR
jgi:hypothetical protein